MWQNVKATIVNNFHKSIELRQELDLWLVYTLWVDYHWERDFFYRERFFLYKLITKRTK